MIELNLKEILDEKKMSRYKLQLSTNINYPRINQLYKKQAKNISFEELDVLTTTLNCTVSDLLVKREDTKK